ncbi:unnamed protein product [Meganyctiphanes norvegica]|uniref:C-type lectin n=1 Tax=Meganyctiphanes norvegica TaxID=48144 RepID=A0AAV2R224_MEGNR
MVVLTVDSRGFASVHNPDNPALGPDSPRIHQKLKKILPDGLNLVKQTGELKTSQVMVHYEPRDQELPEVAHQTERGLLNLSNFQRSDLEENKMQSEMAVRIVSKCDDGGVAIGGECYWFNEELKNWDDAVLACASRGRALASPADPGAILQYAYGKYSQFYSGFWLGGSDVASEGTWVWQSGEPLGDRFPWDPENGHGEPNNANGDENCLEMRIHENRYNDIQCHNTKGYICEGCGGEYTSDNGIIQHPMNGGDYKNNEDCIWTIRATGPIRITFNRFNTEDRYDYLYVR